MKALILIIVLLLIGFGIWWFVREPETTDIGDNPPGTVEVQDENIDLGEFQDKG